MSESTVLFVTATSSNFLKIMQKVLVELNAWQRSLLDVEQEKQGYENRLSFLVSSKKDWSNGVVSVSTHNFDLFSLDFRVAGESRSLSIFLDCSNDFSGIYEGEKLIFSLGAWGMCHDIMAVITLAVEEFGDVYYCSNDCKYEFKKL